MPSSKPDEMYAIDASETAYKIDVNASIVATELVKVNRAIEALKHVQSALEENATHMLKTGVYVPGWHLEPISGHARWKANVNAAMLKVLTGKDLSENSLVSPAQAIKKGVSEVIVKSFSERPKTGLKLASGDASEKLKG